MTYEEMWFTLKSWLENDCAHGARHKSIRALLLMKELEETKAKEKEKPDEQGTQG